MADNRSNKKFNDSCIKIFKFLMLLHEDKAFYDDVIDIFKSDGKHDNINVILNRYLNTFKVFGLDVKKVNNKFQLLNTPFGTEFSEDDCKVILMFEKLAKDLPDSKMKSNINDFISGLKCNFDVNTKANYRNLSENEKIDYTFHYSSSKEQIELCEKYCNDNCRVNIMYFKNGEKISLCCDPIQVIYIDKNTYLRCGIKESEFEDILISDIISINGTPSGKKVTDKTPSATVIYKLKGRLAKAYTLKENETLMEALPDGSIVISNKDEPVNTLLNRLMRYDFDCEIIRPNYIKERMKELISNTLDLYNDEDLE